MEAARTARSSAFAMRHCEAMPKSIGRAGTAGLKIPRHRDSQPDTTTLSAPNAPGQRYIPLDSIDDMPMLNLGPSASGGHFTQVKNTASVAASFRLFIKLEGKEGSEAPAQLLPARDLHARVGH